jgi:3-methyladenine DNA glycosylase AlkD
LDRCEVTPTKQRAARYSDPTIERLLTRLQKLGSAENRAGMARYAIRSEHAFGVRADQIRALARQSGRDHERAPALWETGWIEAAADDERNFVKKAVNWALRSIGKRNPRLHRAALATATALADQPSKSACWIGKDALRELKNQAVVQRIVAAEQKRTAAAAKRPAPRSRILSG